MSGKTLTRSSADRISAVRELQIIIEAFAKPFRHPASAVERTIKLSGSTRAAIKTVFAQSQNFRRRTRDTAHRVGNRTRRKKNGGFTGHD